MEVKAVMQWRWWWWWWCNRWRWWWRRWCRHNSHPDHWRHHRHFDKTITGTETSSIWELTFFLLILHNVTLTIASYLLAYISELLVQLCQHYAIIHVLLGFMWRIFNDNNNYYYYHNNNDLVVADLIFTSASDGSVLLLRCEDDMCIDRQHTLVIVTVRLTSKTLFLNSLYLLTQTFYVSMCALQLFSTVF